MKFWIADVALGMSAGAAAAAQEDCQILTVREAVAQARKLDGKVVCVRGLIEPKATGSADSRLVYEIIDGRLGPPSSGRAIARIGLVDWSPETGVEPSQYKPESFEQLRKTGLQEVVFRGSLFYKKGMIRKLQQRLPQGAPYYSLRGLSFRIELVLLEVLEVHPQ